MKAYQRLYDSFLLRLWKDGPEPDWHASLQNIATGECHNFADLNGLYSFLEQATTAAFSLQPGQNHFSEISYLSD